jgi:aminoglycoside/choline kinase family phosphotransferase
VRERWLGATGTKVPEICVEGELDLPEGTLLLDDVGDDDALREAHSEGRPVVVRASTPEEIVAALARPEVACVLVPADRDDLRQVDLTALTYGP